MHQVFFSLTYHYRGHRDGIGNAGGDCYVPDVGLPSGTIYQHITRIAGCEDNNPDSLPRLCRNHHTGRLAIRL